MKLLKQRVAKKLIIMKDEDNGVLINCSYNIGNNYIYVYGA